MVVSVSLLFLCSNKVIVNELYIALEPANATLDLSIRYKTAVVLGGFADFDEKRGVIRFTDAAERLFKAIELFQKKAIDTLVISGGAAVVTGNKIAESIYVKNYLIQFGLDSSRLLIESKSKNTFENAQFTLREMKSAGLKPEILLITSASHMPRSESVFRKAGFAVQPCPVNFISKCQRGYILADYLIPSSEALFRFDAAIKEFIGIIAYKITGKM